MFDSLDVGGAAADVFHAIALFVPKFLAFAAILVIGWAIARIARTVCATVLARIGFHRVVDNSGLNRFLARTSSAGDDNRVAARTALDASDLIARLVYYAVLLIAAQVAFGIFGPNPVSALITDVVAWLPRAAIAIVIIVVAAAIARTVRRIVTAALGSLSFAGPLATVAAAFVLGLGVIAALGQIGVATTVTTPLLITVLATVAGILIVGAGGGLIRPMQQRWERVLSSAETQVGNTGEQAAAYLAGHADTTAMTGTTAGTDPDLTGSVMAGTGSAAGRETGRPPGWPVLSDEPTARAPGGRSRRGPATPG
jgi:hypothetical protein